MTKQMIEGCIPDTDENDAHYILRRHVMEKQIGAHNHYYFHAGE